MGIILCVPALVGFVNVAKRTWPVDEFFQALFLAGAAAGSIYVGLWNYHSTGDHINYNAGYLGFYCVFLTVY